MHVPGEIWGSGTLADTKCRHTAVTDNCRTLSPKIDLDGALGIARQLLFPQDIKAQPLFLLLILLKICDEKLLTQRWRQFTVLQTQSLNQPIALLKS